MPQTQEPTGHIPDLARPDPNPRTPRIKLPANACDSHAHIRGPADRYPHYARRIYTPPEASLAEYEHMLSVIGASRGVLVQPSPYGLDNSCLLDTLAERPDTLRGIACLPDDVSDAELESMNEQGVRGIRLNIVDTRDSKGVMPIESVRRFAERFAPLGWNLEFLAHVNEFPDLDRLLDGLPVPVVFGHMGYVPAGLGTGDAGFQAMLRMMRDGRAYAKLTAPYRMSAGDLPFADVVPFARALVETAPAQVLWGTDWPHGKAEWPIPMPNDGDLTDLLSDWITDESLMQQILVDNPARLYGF